MIEITATGDFDRGPSRGLNAIGQLVGKEFVVRGESPFGKGKPVNMRGRKKRILKEEIYD